MQRGVGVASLEDLCEGSANGYATVMLDMHRLFVRFGSIDAGFFNEIHVLCIRKLCVYLIDNTTYAEGRCDSSSPQPSTKSLCSHAKTKFMFS